MNTFALPSHCCPPTYLGNKTIIQWRDNDFRDQTTFEFQIGHTNLCPVQIWSKSILDWSKQFWTQNLLGLKFVLKRHFWPSSKYFGPCRNLFWKPKKSKSESKPKPKPKPKSKPKTKTKIKIIHLSIWIKKITFINDTFWLL